MHQYIYIDKQSDPFSLYIYMSLHRLTIPKFVLKASENKLLFLANTHSTPPQYCLLKINYLRTHKSVGSL